MTYDIVVICFNNNSISFWFLIQEDTQTLSSRRRTRRSTENSARQCFGHGCVFEARPASKYCSDKCGLELARKLVIYLYLRSMNSICSSRLLQFLPMRLMQWQSIPSVADTLNKNAIEEIRTEIESIKQKLVVLDDRQRELDQIIERGKQLKAIKDSNVTKKKTFSQLKFDRIFSFRKMKRIVTNQIGCVFVFCVTRKLVKNLIHVISINVLFG